MQRVSVINEYEEGGLRMIDLECMVKSLRLTWLKRIFSGINGPWKSFLLHLLSLLGGFFFLACNYNISDYTIPSQFYDKLVLVVKVPSDFCDRKELDEYYLE